MGRPRSWQGEKFTNPGWECVATGWELVPLPRRSLPRPSIRCEKLPWLRTSWPWSKQLDMFKNMEENLGGIFQQHKQENQKNPEFWVHFQDACVTTGVILCPLEKDFGPRCGRFLSWAGSPDYWSVPDPEVQEWRADNAGETTSTVVKRKGQIHTGYQPRQPDRGQDETKHTCLWLPASSLRVVPTSVSLFQLSSVLVTLWCCSWRRNMATWRGGISKSLLSGRPSESH